MFKLLKLIIIIILVLIRIEISNNELLNSNWNSQFGTVGYMNIFSLAQKKSHWRENDFPRFSTLFYYSEDNSHFHCYLVFSLGSVSGWSVLHHFSTMNTVEWQTLPWCLVKLYCSKNSSVTTHLMGCFCSVDELWYGTKTKNNSCNPGPFKRFLNAF